MHGTSQPRVTAKSVVTSIEPGSGVVIGSFAAMDDSAVAEVVGRARAAGRWWADLGFAERRARLIAWGDEVSARSSELAELIHRENGKPADDAYLIEIVSAVGHLTWAAQNAKKVLGPRRVAGTSLLPHVRGRLSYEPVGVVGVIGPWNYPFFTPMGSISYALAAGNAVVFKPSEFTTAVGGWLVDSFARVVPEYPVLQLATGYGPTGAALCHSGVDVVAFTGSVETGRKVLASCAETMTPVVLELGGKDAMIVAPDADVRRAARAAVWGAMSNGGQSCTGIERAFVHAEVYEEFVSVATDAVAEISVGPGVSHYGPATMPSQIEIVRRHVDDAMARGATAIGDSPLVLTGPDGVGGWVRPTILLDVAADSEVLQDETFGPILPIVKVESVAEAIERTNESDYGLGASVWSRDDGMRIARQIDTGMVAINSVMTFAALPELPFGGTHHSGLGRIHGADGLRSFARPKSYAVAARPLLEIMDFARPAWVAAALDRLDRATRTARPRHRRRRMSSTGVHDGRNVAGS